VIDIFSADEIRAQLRAQKIPEHLIERTLALRGGNISGISRTSDVPSADQLEAEDARLEKEHELAGDRQLKALGFEVVKFSHPGKTKQTPGIPDRRYYHRARRIAFWWEAKSATGTQRPDQRGFQEMCDAVGDLYVLGTDQDLFAWLVERGIAVRDECGNLVTPAVTAATARVG
jgi:hypothetical protein